VIGWLLASDEPVIRYRTRTWLLDQPEADLSVRSERERLTAGVGIAALLDFASVATADPYRKWAGLHWRLISLADFGFPADRPDIRARLDEGIDRELAWIAKPRELEGQPRVNGLYRTHASIHGNAVYVASRLGRADDERVRQLVGKLLEWQWPDGGWNCDKRASGYRSSFHESWATALGLAAYHHALGGAADGLAGDALTAAERTAELLLEHRLYRTLDGTRQLHSSMAALHWPAYWHYDFLGGLRVLRATGALRDQRASSAVDHLESKRRPDGSFDAARSWWLAPTRPTAPVDVFDWGKGGSSETLTIHALSILKAAGRW
jgi:hypothetical protein